MQKFRTAQETGWVSCYVSATSDMCATLVLPQIRVLRQCYLRYVCYVSATSDTCAALVLPQIRVLR